MPMEIVAVADDKPLFRYRRLREKLQTAYPGTTLEKRGDLWNRLEETDLSTHFHENNRGTGFPKYGYMRKGISIQILQIGTLKLSHRISVVLGAPACQTEAEDKARLIDLVFLLFTSKTTEELSNMSNAALREFFNSQADPYYHIQTVSLTERPGWNARRGRHVYNIVGKAEQLARELVEGRSGQSSPSNAVETLVRSNWSCLANNSGQDTSQLMDELLCAMMTPNADTTRLTTKLDSRFGGLTAGCNLDEEMPGLSGINIDPNNDMVVFNDGRVGTALASMGKMRKHKYILTFYNEKSAQMYFILREIRRAGLHFNYSVDGPIILQLLGTGTMHRIGYDIVDKKYRVVRTYSSRNSEEIIAACTAKIVTHSSTGTMNDV